jgi:hypothetical protein
MIAPRTRRVLAKIWADALIVHVGATPTQPILAEGCLDARCAVLFVHGRCYSRNLLSRRQVVAEDVQS